MINYEKLFEIMKRRGIKKTELLKIISSGSLAKLSKGQNLQTEVIDKICEYLNVQPGEIMTYKKIFAIENLNPNEENDITSKILYEMGYRQRVVLYEPSEVEEFIENPTQPTDMYISKIIHEKLEDIIKLPPDFINENEITNNPAFTKILLERMNIKKTE